MKIRLVAGVLFLAAMMLSGQKVYGQSFDLAKGNEFYNDALYKEAIPLYERVLEKNLDAEVVQKLANCYWLTNDPVKAEQWYGKLLQLGSVYAQYSFEYAQVLKTNGKYTEAKKWFLEYAKIDAEKGQQFAASCDYAARYASNPNRNFTIRELDNANTRSSDYAPILYQGGLLFASSRSVAVQREEDVNWTSDAFNQHYTYREVNQDSAVVRPLRGYIGRDINDSPCSFSTRDGMVAITSNNFMDGIRHIAGSGMMMDIYFYEIKSVREWRHDTEEFFAFNAQVEDKEPFSTGMPCFSPGGEALYFTSDRPGGLGGYDIYVCYKTKNGWTQPKNLGFPVNTPGNELSPFVDDNGRLYFSSDWHFGFGGMDIFTAERLPYGWGDVRNLGTEINSAYDDMYFIINAREKQGYFTSNRPSQTGGNEDIYAFTQENVLLAHQKNPTLKPGEWFMLEQAFERSGQASLGEVIETKEMYELLLALYDNPNAIFQINAFTDSRGSDDSNLRLSQRRADALFDFIEQKGLNSSRIVKVGYGEQFILNKCKNDVPCTAAEHKKNRRIEIYMIGSVNDEGNAEIMYDARPNQRKFLETPVTVPLNELQTSNLFTPPKRPSSSSNTTASRKKPTRKSHYAIGDVIEVANIYYEHGKASIDEKNSPGLSELLDILEEHPHVVLEIGSHTDATGPSDYNKELSQKRADAVKKYLVRKGIGENRLNAVGYGESRILNKCKDDVDCTDSEHAINRRTEFRVVAQTGFKVGDIIKVEHIYYESEEYKLDTKRSRGLAEILQILEDNPISVEIRSHTDSKGAADFNQELSEKRAKAVYDYLVEKGVSKSRLKYKGYGETELLNHCKDGTRCSDSEHAVNRRTEFKVIGLR